MAISQPKTLSDNEIQRLIQLVQKTQWNYQLKQFEDAALIEIKKSLSRARREIAQELRVLGPQMEVWEKERLLAVADELQDMTIAVRAQIAGDITEVATMAGAESYLKHNDILSFGGRVPNFNPVSLSASQLQSMVSGTPIGGHLLNEWVERSFASNIQDVFKSEIMTGMLKGEGYPALVKRFDIRAFKGLEGDIEALTRSYVQSINVQAMQDVAEANKDIIKGKKWSSATENGSAKTGRGICIRCLSLDSRDEVYPLDGGPPMILHVGCRCVWEYVTKTFRELGVDIDEIKEAYRPATVRGFIDPETGKIFPQRVGTGGRRIISTERYLGRYEDWLKTQSKAIQIQTLGPGRYELWKSGVSLGDMTDKNGNLKLIKEMKFVTSKPEIIRTTNMTDAQKAMSKFDVSKTDKMAILDYTGEQFGMINGYLRGRRAAILPEAQKTISGLDSFLESAPKVETTSYRGVMLDEKIFNEWKTLKKGGLFADKGFMSTTHDKSVIDAFKGSAQYQAEIHIKGKNGVLIESFSDAKEEKEILFKRGSTFNVEKIEVKKDKYSGKITLFLVEK